MTESERLLPAPQATITHGLIDSRGPLLSECECVTVSTRARQPIGG